MRRYGEPVNPDRPYRNRPGAYGVVRSGADLLVTEDIEEDEYQLPGGGIDAGEGPVRALHRECLEETGWTIQIQRRLGVFQRYCFMPDYDQWARKVCHVYLCRPVLHRGPPSEPNHRALWMPLGLAARLLGPPDHRQFVASLAARA